jgi:hypothetical protein
MSPDADRPSTDYTRRAVLSRTSAALATSLSALTAGCLSGLPPLGSDQRYGRLRAPAVEPPSYRRWLPALSSVAQVPQVPGGYHFTVLTDAAGRSDAPELIALRRAHVKAATDYFGVGFAAYDRIITTMFGTVLEADFDPQTVTETLSQTRYAHDGTYRDYDVFAREDVPRRVAVGDGTLVWTSAYHHDAPALEALVDAGAGERQRFHEASRPFDRLTTAAGGPPYLGVNAQLQDPTGRAALLADSFRFGEDAAYQLVQYRYRDDPPTAQQLEDALRTDDFRFADPARAFDVAVDGRLATVEARVPYRDDGAEPVDYPQVTWGVDVDADADTVTFRHEGGDAVPAHRLFFDVDRPAAPGRIDKRPIWQGAETVDTGSTATVDLSDVEDPTDVSLVYATSDVAFHVLFGVELWGDRDG